MRKPLAALAVLVVSAVLVASCTVDASLTTDRAGRIVGVQAVRFASTLRQLTVAVGVDCYGPAVELLWRRTTAQASRE